MLSTEEFKKNRITDFLLSLGFVPAKQQGFNVWYISPLRNERNASFKVNTNLNLWYDFGIGKGGNIIDLAILLFKSSNISNILNKVEGLSSTSQMNTFSFQQQNSNNSFENIKIKNLIHPALIDYLYSRGISEKLAKSECRQIDYCCHGKNYFAIGFKNKAGGYEIRNKFFKGCIPPKDISIKKTLKNTDSCLVFEGFINYLSFFECIRSGMLPTNEYKAQDYIILNSVSTVQKSIHILSQYISIRCYLDNDFAGRNTYNFIHHTLGNKVSDASFLYAGKNDINDYLCDITNK